MVARPRVPSPPSHILGTLSAQPPQALLEDDEETPPLSQVHNFIPSLQSQGPHTYLHSQRPLSPALSERHPQPMGQIHSSSPVHKGPDHERTAAVAPHLLEAYTTGGVHQSSSPLMTSSHFSTAGPLTSAQTKRNEQRSKTPNVKEERAAHSPALPASPFSPALRPDTYKSVDSKLGADRRSGEGSRSVPHPPDSPGPQPERIKQESKSSKKTPDVKLKNMGSWASLAQRSQSTQASSLRSSSDSFEHFKRAAREKEERERQLRAQAEEAKRSEHKPRRDDEDTVDLTRRSHDEVRRSHDDVRRTHDEVRRSHDEVRGHQEQPSPRGPTPPAPAQAPPTHSPQAPATPPTAAQTALDQQRELARRREQERRHREAMADTIDINFQSDLMAIFEENLF